MFDIENFFVKLFYYLLNNRFVIIGNPVMRNKKKIEYKLI